VREAIQRLAWEGLLTVRPRAGLEIAPLHAADWLRVLDARRGVEIVLARSAARFLTTETAALFQSAAVSMHAAVLAKDVFGFLEADKSLDEALARAADNDFAARLAAPLQSHSRRFWFRYQSGTGLAESASNHVALIRAILDRDETEAGEQADQLMALLRLHAQAAAMR
jgi:DNA-binding GntR family transcriptional regulator